MPIVHRIAIFAMKPTISSRMPKVIMTAPL
jgi:hypothetical protein